MFNKELLLHDNKKNTYEAFCLTVSRITYELFGTADMTLYEYAQLNGIYPVTVTGEDSPYTTARSNCALISMTERIIAGSTLNYYWILTPINNYVYVYTRTVSSVTITDSTAYVIGDYDGKAYLMGAGTVSTGSLTLAELSNNQNLYWYN